MMHHLYKEPQDGNECTPDDWKQNKSIDPQVFAVDPGIKYNIDSSSRMIPTNTQLKESRRELKVIVIFALGFTSGFVWALFTIMGTKI